MCAFKVSGTPLAVAQKTLLRASTLAFVAGLAGCASTPENYAAARVAGYSQVAAGPVVEIESDGLPAQTPPLVRAEQHRDDPSEPFSRNYGGPNPAAEYTPPPTRAPVHVVPKMAVQEVPVDLPPAFRSQLVAALRSDE